MKKFSVSIAFLLTVVRCYADEGMWLPLLLGQQVYKNMVSRGLKLKPEQLYSANRSSLKDAIIIFGAGCTGEIVSKQGLIFTNHHCGYSQIASASTVEANYLRDGFWATDKSKEIPSNNLSVKFLNRIEDVTRRVLDSLSGLTGSERASRLTRVQKNIRNAVTANDEFKDAVVASMFKGNQFFMYVYDVYKDVRLVGTPPESIGKFGGDTDNWEWPRHTGDFSVFRVYMSSNGKPANYSPSNVAYKPKHYLPVSVKGIKDGDYAMIFGYPGGTNRYESSFGIKLATKVNNPALVKLRDMRLKYMFEEMKKSPDVKLKLASNYATVANYWKFFAGETQQLLKYDVYGQKQKAEQAFVNWGKGKPEYQSVFNEYGSNYEAWKPYALHRVYIEEGIKGSPLLKFINASWIDSLESVLSKKDAAKEEINKAIEKADSTRKAFLASEDRFSDRNITADVLRMFYEDIDKNQHPKNFYQELFREYENNMEGYRKYTDQVFTTTMAFNDEAWKQFKDRPKLQDLQADPAYKLAATFIKDYNDKSGKMYTSFTDKNNDLARLYLKGIMEQDKAKAAMMYPDANSTMRVSFGNVKSYNPRDAVHFREVTTMKGVMEKYKPGDYEFDLPKKFVDLYRARNFGRYTDAKEKDIVVGFITTNDITGGNSGSPVINANGELIGLAFDGNYEALSHKLAFDKDLNRTICVDVRYVLWCIEKLGGAKNIVDELTLITK
jgi:hypothetical protein